MSGPISNQLKALLVAGDITEKGIKVRRTDCFTVQHFSYGCRRLRNDEGAPYGPTVPAYLDFTIRVAAGEKEKVFYDRILRSETFRYSFLFNGSFNDKQYLSTYDDALVATGYIVDMEEIHGDPSPGPSPEQTLLRVRLLLSKLSYVGTERVMELTITKD